jgi:hypothetical protein
MFSETRYARNGDLRVAQRRSAMFSVPQRAIRCAMAIRDAVQALGIGTSSAMRVKDFARCSRLSSPR